MNKFAGMLKKLNVDVTDMLSTLGEGVRLVDTAFTILYQNEAMNALVGDKTGEKCYRAQHGAESPCEGCPVAETLSDGRPRMVERSMTADGVERRFIVTASTVRDVNGGVVGVTEVVREITDKALAERRLRENNEILRQIADHLEPIIWIVSADLEKVIFVNGSYRKIMERPVRELFDDPTAWMKSVHPDDADMVKEALGRLATGETLRCEYRLLMPDGRVKWLLDLGFPVYGEDGKVARFCGIAAEITKEKNRAVEVEEGYGILKQVAENMESMLYLLEADMSRVVYANGAYERVWGRPLEGLYADPMDWMKSIHPEDLVKLKPEIEGHEGPRNYSSEYRIVRPDGEVRHILDKGFPIFDSEGRHIRYAGIATDMTESREEEDRKYGFYSMLRHDLQGLLMLIRGNIDILKDSSKNSDMAPECAVSLDAISRNTELIAGIVNDLAFYAKLDTRNYRLKLAACELDLLLAEIAIMQKDRVEAGGFGLGLDVQAELPAVSADYGLLLRAVINLVTNAVNYSGGDKITLSAAMTVRDGREYVGVTVSDNGRGISAEHHEKIFQSHYRIPSSRKSFGSGLGLAIVRQIAEAHSGFAWVESEPGKGCAFTVAIPVPSQGA